MLVLSASTGLTVDPSGHSCLPLRDEVRLYTRAELEVLVRESGFEVQRGDSGVQVDAASGSEARTIQLMARPVPAPPAALAVASWGTPLDARLDLRVRARRDIVAGLAA